MGLWSSIRNWARGYEEEVAPKPAPVAPAPVEPDPDEKMRMLAEEAEKWLWVREKGHNRGTEVEMFQREVDNKARGEPWCMSFVQFCVGQVDRRLAEKYDNYTPSKMFKTEHCLTCWNKTDHSFRAGLDEDVLSPGMVIIWQYIMNGKPTSSGHVGIVFSGSDGFNFMTVEGNTHDQTSIVREGDGVYLVRRNLDNRGSFRVKGILRPW
jgi:hypothetical protein